MKSFNLIIVKVLSSEKWTTFSCHNLQSVTISKPIAGDTVASSKQGCFCKALRMVSYDYMLSYFQCTQISCVCQDISVLVWSFQRSLLLFN